MPKVAIITFHRAINYGAVLQTVALSTYLKNKGYEVNVIDYRSSFIEQSYKTKISLSPSGLKQLIYLPFTERKKRSFRSFVANNVDLTKPIYSKEELKALAENYDFIITGSDQVWNGRWTDNDEAYFLDFCPADKRVSYAASIGKPEITDEEKERFKRLVADYKSISVREKSGKPILQELMDNEINVNCDPVALLKPDEWNKLAVAPKEKNYVLVYMLVPSQSLMDSAVALSKKLNCELLLISDNMRKQYNATYKRFLTVEQFLGLFSNAKYVVTNSFHGSMFSVVFEKPVFVELQKYKGAPNSRLSDLLSNLGMDNCILESIDQIENLPDIDYDEVREKLDLMRKSTDGYFANIQ